MVCTKRINLKLLGLLIALGMVLFSSCKRSSKDEEFLGTEEIVMAPEGFTGVTDDFKAFVKSKISGVSTEIVDYNLATQRLQFSNRNAYFTASLSHRVTWKLTLTGLNSGAEYTFMETSDVINEGNTFWEGRNQGSRFFVPDEVVAVKLSFCGSSIVELDTMKFNSTPASVFAYTGKKLATLPNGDSVSCLLVVDDFESGVAPIRTSYSDQADGDGKAVFFESTAQQVDGLFSYFMTGTDKNGNTYCGGSSNENLTELYVFSRNNTYPAEQTYINAYIYGTGASNTAILFQVYEADTATTSTIASINVASTDMWYQLVEVNWTGWRKVSLRYADFRPANNPANGGSGNRIKQPDKIAGMAIELSSYPNPNASPTLYLDVVSITTGGPFVP
jgi:hypothetical protein